MGKAPHRTGRLVERERVRIAIAVVVLVLFAVVLVAGLAGPTAVAAMGVVLDRLDRLVRTITRR